MGSQEDRQRLDAAIKRRDDAKDRIQALRGRLSAAQEEVVAIEKECLERGIKPGQLGAAIKQLEKRYARELEAFEQEMDKVEEALEPFKES